MNSWVTHVRFFGGVGTLSLYLSPGEQRAH
jgi:hypothetical protein